MQRKPFKALVCLAFGMIIGFSAFAWGSDGIGLTLTPGVEADALSADTGIQPVTQTPPRSSSRSYGSGSGTRSRSYPTRAARPVHPAYVPQPTYAPPPPGLPNIFPFAGLGFGALSCTAYLPRIGCKQFQLNAKLWYAKLNPSTQIWGVSTPTTPGTEIDLERDLDLGKFQEIPEYEVRYQIRGNWGLRYAFIPMQFEEDNTVRTGGFYFGNIFYPGGSTIKSRWERFIHKTDLIYDWYQARHAVSSIFAGYSFYDDTLQIGIPNVQSRQRNQSFGLAYAGIEIDRVIRRIGGGTVSLNCKWSMLFLEKYVGWDGYAVGRMAIPMNSGRWGYLEAGWRWMVLERSRPTNTDRTNLDGLIGAVGLVF